MRKLTSIAIVAVLLMMASACSRAPQRQQAYDRTGYWNEASRSAAGDSDVPVPAPIVEIGADARDIYDAAQASDWPTATAKMAALKKAAAEAVDLPGSNVDEQKLSSLVPVLDRAVAQPDRETAMQIANQVTLIAADLAAPYEARPPLEITELDYLARELQIQAAAGNLDAAKITGTRIASTWKQLRPQVEAKAGAAAANRIDSLVGQIEQADTPATYGLPAESMLQELNALQNAFTP